MKNKTDIKKTSQALRRVVMVVYPDAHILDVFGPLEVLTGAKLFLPDNIQPYEVHVVAHKAGSISTTSGLTIEADQSFEDAKNDSRPIDTLMISGGHGTVDALEDQYLLDFVSHAAGQADRVVSICTGAMILAEVGLLDGKKSNDPLVVVSCII